MTDKESIIALENELVRAIKAHDITTLDSLLHHDLLFITPDGQTVTKKMDLDAHRSGAMVVDKLISTIEQISIIGSTAVAVVVYDTKGNMMGTPIEGRFKYIRVWQSVDGAMKVVGGSCVQLMDK